MCCNHCVLCSDKTWTKHEQFLLLILKFIFPKCGVWQCNVHNLDFEPFCPFQSLLLRLQIDSLCNVHCCNPHNCRKMVRIIQWILTREQIILHVRTPKWIAALQESYSCISRNMCTTFTFLFKIFYASNYAVYKEKSLLLKI